MAELLEDFEFGSQASPYPWDEWFDGKIRKLIRGEDYKSQTESFRSTAQEQAKKRGFVLRCRAVDGGLVIQATRPEPMKAK